MKELTKGYPAKVIMAFAVPIMCGFIFQQLYGIVDSKIVSAYVGSDALGAVGATAVVTNTLIGFINGLTQGFAIPVANCFGAGEKKNMRQYVAGSIKLTFATAIVLTVFCYISIGKILELLRTPDDIMELSMDYVKIIILGIIFTAVYNLCANVLRSVGDSKTPLFCLIVAVILNVGLDILFVKYFDWKIEGAAYATIISQGVSALLCLLFVLFRFREVIPQKDEWYVDGAKYDNLIATGLAMGLMSCIVNIGTVILQGAINSLGTAIVTAHTAARRIFDISSVTIYSIGVSMTTYASQNMGARKPERVSRGLRQTLVIATIMTTILIAIIFLFSRAIFEWLVSSDDKTIIDAAVMYSKISVIFYYVLGPLMIMRCTLQGMGRKIMPVLSSVLEMIIKIVSAIFLVPIFEYRGVAFTEPVSWCGMLIILVSCYLMNRPEKILTRLEEGKQYIENKNQN